MVVVAMVVVAMVVVAVGVADGGGISWASNVLYHSSNDLDATHSDTTRKSGRALRLFTSGKLRTVLKISLAKLTTLD